MKIQQQILHYFYFFNINTKKNTIDKNGDISEIIASSSNKLSNIEQKKEYWGLVVDNIGKNIDTVDDT